jgi:hypothetical protein
MGWDHVSELQPQTDLLFIPQVIHEHEEPWWNDTDREKRRTTVICDLQPDHSDNECL